MAVQAEFDRERCIAADLDEGRPPVAVDDVDVVVVHAHRAAGVLEVQVPALTLRHSVPGPDAFLGDSDQDDAMCPSKDLPVAFDDIVLAFSLAKFDPRDAVPIGPAAQALLELLGDLAEKRWRGNALSTYAMQEPDHAARLLQPRDVGIQVQSIHASDVECCVVV